MYDSWYYDQIKEYTDVFAKEWEIFTLTKSPSCTSHEFEVKPLARESVPFWVKGQSEDIVAPEDPDNIQPPCPRLLITRHSQHETYEPKPDCLPFGKQEFCDIVRKLGLPPECIYTRIHGGASGCFSLHVRKNDEGQLRKIGFVLRVPHAPRNEIKSIWSLALSWDAKSRLTHAVFDGASDHDRDLLLGSLNAAPLHHLAHPLLIPCLLLDQLQLYYNSNWRSISRELFQIERRLGLTRGRSKANPWSWDQERFRSITYDISDVTTGLVYIERRISFTISFAKSLENNIDFIDSQLDNNAQSTQASEDLKEKLRNIIPFLENQLHQVQCLQKRSQAFTTTAHTIVAQIDNNTNIRIGVAAKHDSTSMMTIAFLTVIFLPATFIASLFGTNFFVFSSTPSGILVSSRFWLYWTITIPLTVVVLAVWRIWMHYQYRPFEQSIRTPEAGYDVVEEKGERDPLHGDGESPFYLYVPR